MAMRIKVCGVRDADSLRQCVELGVDWVGFNFVPDSPRWIEPDEARALIDSLSDDGPVPVGIFQDQAPNNVLRAAKKAGVGVIQLHGTEPPPYCAALGGPIEVWKALVGESATRQEFEAYAPYVDGFVIDGRVGGSGASWDYREARPLFAACDDLPVLLAGGLSPANVAHAAEAAIASAVDVASGVEEAGVMSAERIAHFVRAARGGEE
jgi:phosphoribosylanthranilate isomerase